MRPNTSKGLARPPIDRRWPFWLAPACLGFALAGCAHERREITPTTLGTDLTKLPRGKMIPFPWPGQSISQAKPSPIDPQAALASGDRPAAR